MFTQVVSARYCTCNHHICGCVKCCFENQISLPTLHAPNVDASGEVNHIRRIVLACERDMEDFTAAMDAVNVDLDEMRARVDATHSIITSRQRVEATMTAEISTMRLDIGDMQEALKNHDSWMEDVSNTLQQMQEKEDNTTEDLINLKNVPWLRNRFFGFGGQRLR